MLWDRFRRTNRRRLVSPDPDVAALRIVAEAEAFLGPIALPADPERRRRLLQAIREAEAKISSVSQNPPRS